MGVEPDRTAPPAKLGRIGMLVHSMRTAILIEGGLFNTIRVSLTILKKEGWSGFRQRVGSTLSKSGRDDYREWIRRYDTLDATDRERIRIKIAQMQQRPLISILMPTYNTPPAWLQEAIDSIRAQIYENWELCIADDASTDPAVRDILENASKLDDRIKVAFRKANGHISAASNSALGLCTGEWVALMDHDDLLPEHALYCVVDTINTHPEARLIFSDEDKISENGLRFDPYFKCDFNLDLFYSHNMISHLGVYRRDIVEEIGGFREGFEGSQDYDLALRFTRRIEPGNIVHIPRVLYHWRRHGSSTASGLASKPYAQEAATRALEEHMAQSGTPARITAESHGFRVEYVLRPLRPPVDIVIVAGEGPGQLARLIEGIERDTDYDNFELHVVASKSAGISRTMDHSGTKPSGQVTFFKYDVPSELLASINAAAGDGHGEYLAVLDGESMIMSPEWLAELVSVASQPGVGVVGAKLLNSTGSVEHAGYVLGIGGLVGSAFRQQPGNSPGYFGRARLISTFSAISGLCMVVKKSRFEEIGGFEERSLSWAFADVDLCLRLHEAGCRNVLNPNALLTVLSPATAKRNAVKPVHLDSDLRFMRERWGESLTDDPCYSPNLTLDFEDFSLAWPPRVAFL